MVAVNESYCLNTVQIQKFLVVSKKSKLALPATKISFVLFLTTYYSPRARGVSADFSLTAINFKSSVNNVNADLLYEHSITAQ